jgi:hypothetical protein
VEETGVPKENHLPESTSTISLISYCLIQLLWYMWFILKNVICYPAVLYFCGSGVVVVILDILWYSCTIECLRTEITDKQTGTFVLLLFVIVIIMYL